MRNRKWISFGVLLLVMVVLFSLYWMMSGNDGSIHRADQHHAMQDEAFVSPMEKPGQTYSMRVYIRGSDCGFYANDQLIYDTYGRGFGSLVGDSIKDINVFLRNGENRFTLKLHSLGEYFEPGDDYECKASVSVGRGRAASDVIAHLHIDYAGQNEFTMGDSAHYQYAFDTGFVPSFSVDDSNAYEHIAIVTGIVNLSNLPEETVDADSVDTAL